jgi:hypothetical protein
MKHIPLAYPSFSPLALMIGIAVTLAGVLLFAVAAVTGPALLPRLAFGIAASSLLGWLVAELLQRTALSRAGDHCSGALPTETSETCRNLIATLRATAAHPDPVFRELVHARLALLTEDFRNWSRGRLDFGGTEAWRTAYEKVLAAPDITEYRSVAWLKSADYWQDLPGQHGMQFNYELIDRGVRIERILIIGWNLWAPECRQPRESIRRWIEDQHYRGVSVLLVRENDLVTEQDLLRDFGIYGDRAVGELHIDDESRTVSFTLSFEQAAIQQFQERWQRLGLFARPYLDAATIDFSVR